MMSSVGLRRFGIGWLVALGVSDCAITVPALPAQAQTVKEKPRPGLCALTARKPPQPRPPQRNPPKHPQSHSAAPRAGYAKTPQ
jgi:hypothetical protein